MTNMSGLPFPQDVCVHHRFLQVYILQAIYILEALHYRLNILQAKYTTGYCTRGYIYILQAIYMYIHIEPALPTRCVRAPRTPACVVRIRVRAR